LLDALTHGQESESTIRETHANDLHKRTESVCAPTIIVKAARGSGGQHHNSFQRLFPEPVINRKGKGGSPSMSADYFLRFGLPICICA